ncbi:hypothetical protein NE237_014658 [Protea cynaroides]|uniref:Glutamine amidotransferase type-2 domain-containing protein n=1 Tax=Protea cynaroides TaxID=273540 RepID=A0A9Q0KCJ1_9MAGN|nr:hypothetical protein NE237_014658 [Protea cynaroides]
MKSENHDGIEVVATISTGNDEVIETKTANAIDMAEPSNGRIDELGQMAARVVDFLNLTLPEFDVVAHFERTIHKSHKCPSLVNYLALITTVEESGSTFNTNSDTEIVLHLIATSKTGPFFLRIVEACKRLKGGFSTVFLTEDKLAALCDPYGFRLLVMERRSNGSIDLIEATSEREVNLGEALEVDKSRVQSFACLLWAFGFSGGGARNGGRQSGSSKLFWNMGYESWESKTCISTLETGRGSSCGGLDARSSTSYAFNMNYQTANQQKGAGQSTNRVMPKISVLWQLYLQQNFEDKMECLTEMDLTSPEFCCSANDNCRSRDGVWSHKARRGSFISKGSAADWRVVTGDRQSARPSQ